MRLSQADGASLDFGTLRLEAVGGNVEAHDCVEFCRMFNGRWGRSTPEHFCCLHDGSGRPCCANRQESIDKMKRAAKRLTGFIWESVKTGTKKLCETQRGCARLSILGKAHNLLEHSSKPWRSRRRRSAGEQASSSEDEHADDDVGLRRRKRERKAGLGRQSHRQLRSHAIVCAVKSVPGAFFGDPSTPDLMLTVAIATAGTRELLSDVFSVERDARLLSCGGD